MRRSRVSTRLRRSTRRFEPNKTAEQYASEWSRKAHVNLKTFDGLRDLGLAYFHNVFMFGMNDEVVHTGYGPMCHYLWALCVGPRRGQSSHG